MHTGVDTAPCCPAPAALDLNRTGEAVAGGLPAISVVVPDSPAASPPTMENSLRNAPSITQLYPAERMEVGPGLLARTVESTH